MAESMDPKSLRVVDLKEELGKRNLSKAGKKDELVARLTEALEQEATTTTVEQKDNIQDAGPTDSNTTTTMEPQPIETVNTTPPASTTPSVPAQPATITTTDASVSEDSTAKSLESPKEAINKEEENKPSVGLKRKVEDDLDTQQEKRTKPSETEASVKAVETTSAEKEEADTPSTTTDTKTNEQFAICVKGFVRPLITKNLSEFINQYGSVKRFWIDPIKTHCYVIYETLEQAKDAFEKIDGTIYPPGTGKNVSVIRLTSTQATQLMDREQEVAQKHGRVNWEKLLERVLNNENIDEPLTTEGNSPSSNAKRRLGGIEQITRQLQQRGPISAIMDQQQQQPASILDRLSADAQISIASSASRPTPALPTTGKSLDELFLKTRTNPPLYYLPVDNEIATKRLEAKMAK